MGKFPPELLSGPDDMVNPFSFLGEAAVRENPKIAGGYGTFGWIKKAGVYSPGCSVAADAVSSLDPPADPLRGAQEMKIATGHFLFSSMTLEDKIKKLRPGFEPVELSQDGVLAAEPDVEFRCSDRVKGTHYPDEFEPLRPLPFRREKGKTVATPDKRVAHLEITSDTAINFDMGKKCRYFHLR
jgi:hypothetical protein